MFDPPYNTRNWTRSQSSTLAALLADAESVEHWRDHNDITWLRFICRDKEVWVWPQGNRLSFHAQIKEQS